MNYKLYKETSFDLSATQQCLYNRGIPVEEQEAWLNAGWESISDWRAIGESDMLKGVELIQECVKNEWDVGLIVDADCDGYTSAAILTNYLFTVYPEWTHFHLKHIMHEGKQHGFADVMELIPDYFKLIISPDGGTNDVEQHKILKERGISSLILDHHEASIKKEDSPALIINIQMTDYPNKALTGAGVVWQFCRAFDELHFNETPHANDFLDLCALGNCGDMADLRGLEIRAIMNLGLSNIKNPFFYSMTKKNAYSINKMNGINYYSMAFYVVPFINGIVRSGTAEEKRRVFDAMLLEYAFDLVDSTKKGQKGTQTKCYEEAVTVAERVKRRQTKAQDEAMGFLEKKIEEEKLNDNAIILICVEPGEIERNLAGLLANKIQAKYQKPCAILTRSKQEGDMEDYFRGSMRNYSLSPIADLKAELERTNEIEFCAGHAAAAGLGIASSHLTSFIDKFNEQYKDVDQTPTYWIDYLWNINNIDNNKILEIGGFDIYGQNIPESLVCIENIPVNSTSVTLMSADKNPTLKIQIGDVSIIKFKSSQSEYERFIQPNTILTAICKCNVNCWQDRVSPQLLVEDFELRTEWIF